MQLTRLINDVLESRCRLAGHSGTSPTRLVLITWVPITLATVAQQTLSKKKDIGSLAIVHRDTEQALVGASLGSTLQVLGSVTP